MVGLASPGGDDIEANAANVPWSNRSSMIVDNVIPEAQTDFLDLDQALQSVRYSLEKSNEQQRALAAKNTLNQSTLKRTHSLPRTRSQKSNENLVNSSTPAANRTRRTLHLSGNPVQQYETPAEEDELLDEALASARRAARRLNVQPSPMHSDPKLHALANVTSSPDMHSAYLTPSPSANRNGVQFGSSMQTPSKPLNVNKQRVEEYVPSHWPTPPYEDNEWAAQTAANIFAQASATHYR